MKYIVYDKMDKCVLNSMRIWNKDIEWLKINHPQTYKKYMKTFPQATLVINLKT